MTARSTDADQPFTIVLDDDEMSVAEGRLRKIDAGPTWAKHRVTIELDEGDTSGHALDASSVSISLHFDDDVEGHALSLHFPTAQKADEFRKRLLATGIVAGALVVGVTAAQLSSTAPATSTTDRAPAPIAAQVPARPIVRRGVPSRCPAAGQPQCPSGRARPAALRPARPAAGEPEPTPCRRPGSGRETVHPDARPTASRRAPVILAVPG